MSGQDLHQTRVAAGYKATLSSPNTSEAAKEHAASLLERIDPSSNASPASTHTPHQPGEVTVDGHEVNRVMGGYKATLKNPNTSEEAKRHAREILAADGYSIDAPEGVSESEHQMRVNAGYKAALNNPNVSEEAKQHAIEYLREHGGM